MKTLTIIGILILGSITAQAQQEITLGKDNDGVKWYTRTTLVEKLRDQRHMSAMYTKPNRKNVRYAIYVEVDCSDNTARLHGMDVFRDGEKIGGVEDVTQWIKPKGMVAVMVKIICEPTQTMAQNN